MVIRINNKVFGEIDLTEYGMTSGGEAEPAVSVYLTNKQRVFKNLRNSYLNTHSVIYSVTVNTIKKDEVLRLKDGRNYKVFVQYNNICFPSIGTIHNDQVYFDMFAGL
jgi:hypothetical protein